MGICSNLKHPAAFLDRDGVLNVDKGYVYRIEDIEWIDGAKEAVKYLNDLGYLVFVVTNQSGIARGYYTEEDVKGLHLWMQAELVQYDAHIDGFFYCPHHPEGSQEKYRMDCKCRKPKSGMIEQAMSTWPIDLAKSFIIGDKKSDVEAGSLAGIKGYLFKGSNLKDFTKAVVLAEDEAGA